MIARALVLAAGLGRRFGGGKLLATLHGRPLLAHTLDPVQEAIRAGLLAGGEVVIAEGDADAERLVLDAGLVPVPNPAPMDGLAGSVRLGLAAMAVLPPDEAGAAVICLGDQPAIRPSTIAALVVAWREGRGRLVRARYTARPDEPGHPTLLDRALWPLAERLSGDTGLQPLLADSPDLLVLDVPGDNPDVDTPDDLLTLEDASR